MVLCAGVCGALSSCGSGDAPREEPRPAPRAVAVSLDPGAGGVTAQAAFGFTGAVIPPDSRVSARLVGGPAGAVVVEPSGRLTVGVGRLRRGSNTVALRARRAGHRTWTGEVRVTRAGTPPVARVPERDTTPPVAILRLRPSDGGREQLGVSPSAEGDRPRRVALRRPAFRATALVRDEGGAGRIRFSTTYSTRCGARVRPRHISFPPAQIVNVRLAPGARVPVEEARSVTIRLPDRRGCVVAGEAWAEATDGHGLQAVSRHIAFAYTPPPG